MTAGGAAASGVAGRGATDGSIPGPTSAAVPGAAAGSAGSVRGGRPDGPLAGWMEVHGAELRAHLTRMLGRPDDADDVLQEVWLTAHRQPPEDGSDANVRAWLYRVATNAALDRLALERRRARLLSSHGHELSEEGAERPPDDGLAEVDREEIRRRVSALPRKQRDAVWLRWIDGASYATVAAKLESTEAAARANVYQGLKRLRSDLAPFWNEEIER